MDMKERPQSGQKSQLDGYTDDLVFGNFVINTIMESKFSESVNPFKTTQSSGHIEELSLYYSALPPNTINILPPVYFAVSQYSGSNMKLNYNDTLRQYAEDLGIAIIHLSIHELPFNKFILYGGVITDYTAITWDEFELELPSWLSYGFFTGVPFDINCETIKALGYGG